MRVYKNQSKPKKQKMTSQDKKEMIIIAVVVFVLAIIISRVVYYFESKDATEIPRSQKLEQRLENQI